jgi:DNA-binding transcriptional LysR family regulator
MIPNNLNLNHLRVFEQVYRARSMTSAGQALRLTQSGVSQHIASLEETLSVKLFDRVKQRLVPTAAAGVLYRKCAEGLQGIEQALTEIRGGAAEVGGTIAVGMPEEFGNNVILPLVAAFCTKHPKARFALSYGLAAEVNDRVLSGELDFAFVDAFGRDRRLASEKVYDETLVLCCVPKLASKGFEELDYVDYQTGGPVLAMWFRHHIGALKHELNVRATGMDVQGVARLVLSGLAAGVLPSHLVSKLEAEGKRLHIFKGCGRPLKNTISVAYLPGRTQSAAASAALEAFREALRG